MSNVTLAEALTMLERAREFARDAEIAVAAVVVDSAGYVVAAERMDGAPFVAVDLAREKAWTAAAFGSPTSVWGEMSQPGQLYWGLAGALGGRLTVLAGGLPIIEDGKVIGGIGVSGGDYKQDQDCGVNALSAARGAARISHSCE